MKPISAVHFFLLSLLLIGFSLPEQVCASVNALVSDFQVNDNSGYSRQENPDIAVDGSGNFICVWQDWINEPLGFYNGYLGQPEVDIYARRIDAEGNLIGPEFKINDGTTAFMQRMPSVAAAGNGSFIVAWVDERNSTFEETFYNIYAQRFDASGNPQGNNFRVNQNTTLYDAERPAVASDQNGNFVIVWEDVSQEQAEFDLYAQRYQSDGTRLGTPIVVGNFPNRHESRYPSIAMKSTGEFVIAFEGIGPGDMHPNIYVQRFSAEGIPQDSNLIVDIQPLEEALVSDPMVGLDGSGNFLVTWKDSRGGYFDVALYGQWFDASGNRIGGNFKVAGQPEYYAVYDLSVNDDGSYCMIWNYDGVSNRTYVAWFSGDSTSSGSPYQITEIESIAEPVIAIQSSGDLMIAWHDEKHLGDIYAQKVQDDSTLVGQPVQINDDFGSGVQVHSDLAVGPNGDFNIVWEDYSDSEGDIYLKRFSVNGTQLSGQVRVNTDAPGNKNLNPAIATDESGLTLVVWEDYRPTGLYNLQIRGQFYSATGTPIDTNIILNTTDYGGYSPAVCALGNGNFIVSWYVANDIFGQVYSKDSGPMGTSFIVNDVSGDYKVRQNPAVAADDSGKFTIVWEDYRYGTDIYAQRYDQNGQPIGSNIKLTESGNWGYEPAIAIKHDGNAYVVWSGYEITFQVIGPSGNLVGANSAISGPAEPYHSFRNPDVSVDRDDRSVFLWENVNFKELLSNGVYGVRLTNVGTLIDSTFKLAGPEAQNPTNVQVTLRDRKIYSTWTDNLHQETGWDIYANVLDFDNLQATDVQSRKPLPHQFQLDQNYPNPFNPVTAISYELPATMEIEVAVFNTLGQKVETLHRGYQTAGRHSIVWNAAGRASGIYYCRLRSANTLRFIKMMLLK